MSATAGPPAGTPAHASLAVKLGGALLAATAVMVVLLLAVLGPRLTQNFVARSDDVVARTTALMNRLAAEHTNSSRDVLIDVIEHTTDARSRMLADLPLAIYGGDVERVREAIRREDAQRGERLKQNVHVLARETQRRANARIEAHLASIAGQQVATTAEFASDQRTSYLLLCGGLLLALIVVLGFLLFRLVVRPVSSLREATRRVALGDLDVVLPVRTNDEIGALAADFSSMVAQLRESRAELTRLNRDLEQEVARKTQHLERAMADLHSTHRHLVQVEKMASIGTLAGGIAHEFNNLIGGIRGCAAEALHDETDPERRQTLEVIQRASERATSITKQLLRFARRSIDKMELVDLGVVVDEALRLVEPEARRRGVRIERKLSPVAATRGDADALHQVFVNLFTNALQAMPGGGTLTVETAGAGDLVSVRVADTGVGIAPEDVDHVFEPFFTRKGQEEDPAQRGSGLGLSVSYGIVEAHGGRLVVTSRLRQGTTFTVSLPAAPAT